MDTVTLSRQDIEDIHSALWNAVNSLSMGWHGWNTPDCSIREEMQSMIETASQRAMAMSTRLEAATGIVAP